MSEPVQWAGAMAASGAAGSALLARGRSLRAGAMVVALVLAPLLVAADVWDTERFRELRESPGQLALIGVAALACIGLLAAVFLRWPAALPLLAFGVLPFRVPLEVGDQTSYLLVPLYAVIYAGVLAAALRAWTGGREPGTDAGDGAPPRAGPGTALERSLGVRAVRAVPWILAIFVALYAVQSSYSDDFSFALENVAFFFVPFSVLLALLLEVRWTPQLLAGLLALAAAEALLFAAVAFWQYAARDLFWNENVIAANEVHTYFRVNSLFWDPNILGRYLVLAIIAVAAYMAWARWMVGMGITAAVCAVLVVALTLTYSQSSLFALLGGLVALAALRWRTRGAVAAVAGLAVVGAVFLAVSGVELDLGSERSIDVETSGRVALIRGGLELAEERPVVGHGSGSFPLEFARRSDSADPTEGSVSHTEPVTVLAEQGIVGLAVWIAFVAAGVLALLRIGPRAPVAQAAIVACFVAMVVHSLAYAGFLIDPITWALLGLGLALARHPALGQVPEGAEPARARERAATEPSLA